MALACCSNTTAGPNSVTSMSIARTTPSIRRFCVAMNSRLAASRSAFASSGVDPTTVE